MLYLTELTNLFGGLSGRNPLTGCDIENSTKDANAKNLLKFRIVLANILKYAIPKYKDLSIDEIKQMIPASPRTPDGFYVQEDNTEDFEDSKHIDFDVLFHTIDDVDKVSIWCDIEPQSNYMSKTDSPDSYDLAARGVYYLSRMISRQLSSGTKLSNYRHLNKCYSIWICFDTLEKTDWKPLVTRYRFQPAETTDDTYYPEQEKNAADLIELIIIRAGGSIESLHNDPSLAGLVNTLWRDISCLPKYIPKTAAEYNVLNKEVTDMCDMKEVGIREGELRGELKGIAKGELKKAVEVVKNLINSGKSLSEALELVNIDRETYEKYISSGI